MDTTKAYEPERYDGTPAEFFGIASDLALLAAWGSALDDIEASERAAAAEDVAICSHHTHR